MNGLRSRRGPRLRLADDLRIGFRFLRSLPGFLRTPFTGEEARAEVAVRLADRGSLFLRMLDRWILVPADGPYGRLLVHAGLDRSEIERLVADEGLEGALSALFRAGVHLTCDEFKGRTPVRRGSLCFTVDPARLIRPDAVVHGLSESSGSRGARTAIPIDFAFVRDHAINTRLALESHGGGSWVHALWSVPGGTTVSHSLGLAKGGTPPRRWFTPVALDEPGLHPRYRLGTRALRLGGWVAGVPLPGPTLAPLDDPMPIVGWMREVLAAGRIPHLWTFASSAVLVCQAARASGACIEGARFTMGGEPTTAARRRVVEETGSVPLPRFGATETDIIAYACPAPDAPDDQHLFHDRYAVIQAGEGNVAGLPRDTILLTSLLGSAPVHLLNVSLGDTAEVGPRACGCPMEALGWPLHIRGIRSFEKLTAGGITLLDFDVIRVLEEVLPARFGGSPTDYQLVEEPEERSTRPEVRLLVHPRLGPLDVQEVADCFLESIGGGNSGERLMELQWRGAGVLRIEREAPRHTVSGKILHLHVR